MKARPFKIPWTLDSFVKLQTDELPHFYDIFHQHPEVQITTILSSTGSVFIGDYIGSFKPGEVYVIGANVPHVFKNDQEYYVPNSGLIAKSKTIFFDEAFMGESMMELPEMRELKGCIQEARRGLCFYGKSAGKISNLVLNVFGKSGIAKVISMLEIFKEMQESEEKIYLTTEPADLNISINEGKRLNNVFRFTMREFHRDITLNEIADVANMSPASFCRYFKERTRKTYTDFLTEVRVSHACKMLKNQQDLSITEACYCSGFSNLSNFNRRFRMIKGMTPSMYQKMAQEERTLIKYDL